MSAPEAETVAAAERDRDDDPQTIADELGGDDPEPVGDHDADAGTATDTADLSPFYDVAATGGATVTVRAGWLDADGEITQLAVTATVPVGQAQTATDVAYGWYVSQLQAALSADAEADGDA